MEEIKLEPFRILRDRLKSVSKLPANPRVTYQGLKVEITLDIIHRLLPIGT